MPNITDHAGADDLARLRQAHPGPRWTFRVTVANGRPLLVAEHEDGGLVSARTREAIEAKIAAAEDRGV